MVFLRLFFFSMFLTGAASANDRFVELCETSPKDSLIANQVSWLTKVLFTSDCRVLSQTISKLQSFDQILPYHPSYGPSIFSAWKGIEDTSRAVRTSASAEMTKDTLFRDLDLFSGFKNLTHINLVGRVTSSGPCKMIEKLPQITGITLLAKNFYAEGIESCLSALGVKEVYLRNDNAKVPILLNKKELSNIRVVGVEKWQGSLRSLRRYPYLKYLHYETTLENADFESLNGSVFLTHLNVETHDISKLSSLVYLRRLFHLTIRSKYESKEGDISFLRTMRLLQELDLDGIKIRDVKVLGELKSLVSVSLNGNEIDSLPDLSGHTQLRSLYVSGNSISTLEGIAEIPRLEDLNVSLNRISDFRPLAKLIHLKNLNLSQNLFANFQVTLPVLKQLQILSLDGYNGEVRDQLGDVSVVLRKLGFHYSVAELQRIQKTMTMDKSRIFTNGCHIRSSLNYAPDLNGFDELKVLSLSYQGLQEFPEIRNLRTLRFLDVSGSSFESIPDLSELRELQRVKMSDSEWPAMVDSSLFTRDHDGAPGTNEGDGVLVNENMQCDLMRWGDPPI